MTIHVAIAFDKNYLTPFYALLTSIFENNKGNTIEIHSIVSGVSLEEKRKIRLFVEANKSQIHYYSIDEKMIAKFVLTSKWTSAVYYRLYFPFVIPSSVTRLLYLDTDILVLDDLSELYKLELGNYPVGAVYDNWVKSAPQLGIEQEGEYFNSGVLLIDVVKWKFQQISEQAFHYLNQFPDRIKFVDQDALNAVLIGKWKKLDKKFNLMYSLIPEGLSKRELRQFIDDKVILHFTLQRPWHLLCKNRFRDLYFQYLKESPIRKNRQIIDFSWDKVPEFFKIRLTEFYFDTPVLQRAWRKARRK